MTSVKNLPAIMQKIVNGAAPNKFTISHLQGLGFKSSNDQGVLPLLKDLGFLTPDGTPTKRYHDYRDKSKSKQVLGDAVKQAYEDLFHIDEQLTENDRPAIIGRFKSAHNVTDAVAERQAMTFLALLKLADITNTTKLPPKPLDQQKKDEEKIQLPSHESVGFAGLRYNIEIHLPATKDIEVYNAIFKSLREHLLVS